ncbi:uncharacterized protein A4U43_C01F17880, partial [Asparagus officinalis]
NEDVVYASSGTQISCIDVHMASSTWKPLETYSYNKEEINQIAFSPNSYFLAAADDSGDVKIIDTRQQCLYKTLRGVHSSICSSVQFLSWKSWSAITGGLDSKLAMWDFSRGRAYKVKDYGNICYIFKYLYDYMLIHNTGLISLFLIWLCPQKDHINYYI